MGGNDETELEIALAGRGAGRAGDGDDGDGDDSDGVAGVDRARDAGRRTGSRHGHSPLPWVALGVGLAVVGSVMAAQVPSAGERPDDVLLDLSSPPSLAWESDLCAPVASLRAVGDAVLVTGETCVEVLDLATGEERWVADDLVRARCGYAGGPSVACLTGPADAGSIVTFDLATGDRTERDADGASGVVAVADGVVESTPVDETSLGLRRVTTDGAEVWSRTVEVDPSLAAGDSAQFGVKGAVLVVWTAPEAVDLDVADGSDVEVTWSDPRGRLIAVGPLDAERSVLDPEGREVATLLPGQLLPSVTDDLEPDVVLVTDEPLDDVTELRLAARHRSGSTLWELPQGAYPVAAAGDVVLLSGTSGADEDVLLAHDVRSGVELWHGDAGTQGPWPLATDGTRFLSEQVDREGHWLVATDATTGEEVWRTRTGDSTSFGVQGIAEDGALLVMSSQTISVWRAD